jgi:hypothetical protein
MTKAVAFLKTILTLIANTAASLTAILFVLLTLAVITGFAVDLRLLHADAYKQALLSAGIYENLPVILADQPVLPQTQTRANQGTTVMLQRLKPDEREALYRYLFPAPWLRTQMEGLLDRFFAYVNQPGNQADMSISLAEVRARIQSPDMAVYIGALMRTLPVCTLDQAMSILSRVAGGGGLSSADLCMPPGIDVQTVAAFFQSQIASNLAAGLPDRLVIPQLENMATRDQLQNLQFARQVLYLSPLLCLGLLLLIVLFAVRSRRSLMRWWGMPLLVTAFGAGVEALSLPPLVSWYLGQTLSANRDLSTRMLDLIIRVSYNLASNVSGFVAIFAVVWGGAGVAMMLASYVMQDSRPKSAAEMVKPGKKGAGWWLALAVLLPVFLVLLAAFGLVFWLVSGGMLVL